MPWAVGVACVAVQVVACCRSVAVCRSVWQCVASCYIVLLYRKALIISTLVYNTSICKKTGGGKHIVIQVCRGV